jgi:hypothetical protein
MLCDGDENSSIPSNVRFLWQEKVHTIPLPKVLWRCRKCWKTMLFFGEDLLAIPVVKGCQNSERFAEPKILLQLKR